MEKTTANGIETGRSIVCAEIGEMMVNCEEPCCRFPTLYEATKKHESKCDMCQAVAIVMRKVTKSEVLKKIREWHTKYRKSNHWTNALVSELENDIKAM